MERDQLARLLHFPPQPQRPGPDASAYGWLPFRRFQFPPIQALEIDPSNGLAVRLRSSHFHLVRDHRPLQHEVPVAEVSPLSQLSPHLRQALFYPVCLCSILVDV